MAASVNDKMATMIKKAILYQYATEVVLIILCLILSVFAVIDIRKIKQIYLYLKVSCIQEVRVSVRVIDIRKIKQIYLYLKVWSNSRSQGRVRVIDIRKIKQIYLYLKVWCNSRGQG